MRLLLHQTTTEPEGEKLHVTKSAKTVSAVLVADGLMHVYWTTGATWPAADIRSLSDAVLGMQAPFDPVLLVPLALTLFGAATIVVCRAAFGRDHRFGGLLQLGTIAVTAGLTARAVAGVVWALGVGSDPDRVFYWLNLLVYTPACIALGALAAGVAELRVHGRFPFARPVSSPHGSEPWRPPAGGLRRPTRWGRHTTRRLPR